MSISKEKNIVATVLFALLQLIFLITNFSAAGCVSTAVILIYWIIRNIVKNSDKEKMLSLYIGNYVGFSFLNVVLIIFFNWVKAITFEKFFAENIQNTSITLVVCAIVGVVLIILARLLKSPKSVLIVILKYAALFVVMFAMLKKYAPITYYPLAGLMFIFPFFLFDLYETVIHNHCDMSIFVSGILSVSAFAVTAVNSPEHAAASFSNIMNLSTLPTIKWYIVVIVAILFLAASFACCFIDDDITMDDAAILSVLGFDFICYAIALRFYTKYLPIFAVALLLINLITLFADDINKKRTEDHIMITKLVIPLSLMLSLVVIYIGFIKGIADVSLIAVAGIACSVALKNKKWWPNLFVVILAVFSCDLAYHYHNSKNIFAFIIVIAIIMSVVFVALTLTSEGIENRTNGILKTAILVVTFCAMLSPFIHTGVSISTDINNKTAKVDQTVSASIGENNAITVKVKPRGKDNSVTQCTYYWDSEKDKVAPATLDKDGKFTIEAKQDKLVVVCTDSNGVISKYEHIFTIK